METEMALIFVFDRALVMPTDYVWILHSLATCRIPYFVTMTMFPMKGITFFLSIGWN